MFEKFAEDVIKRTNEKLADILPDRMDIEDWLSGTLEERNNYADSIGEGNYQLFKLKGKPHPAVGQGNESIVYPAIGSTAKGKFKFNNQQASDYNFVIKEPVKYKNNKLLYDLLEAELELSQQIDRKKDIQLNPKNVWLPFNDFEGGKNKGVIVSQRLFETPGKLNPEEAIRTLNRELRNSSTKNKIINTEHIKAGNNLIGVPEIQGKSGNSYKLSAFGIHLGKDNRLKLHNLMFDSEGKLKVMDYIAKLLKNRGV